MNTMLSTPVDEQNHKHPPSLPNHSDGGTLSLADRAALHLGVALITWSRRPRTVAAQPSREQLSERRKAAADRASREREWLLALSFNHPRR